MKNIPLTRDLLLKLVDYDPDAGTLVWRKRTQKMMEHKHSAAMFNTSYAGKNVGTTSPASKDIRVFLGGKTYSVRSLIYLIMTGSFPDGRTVNLSGEKHNLRWQNIATMADVKQAKKDGVALAKEKADSEINRTPYPGVVWSGQLERFVAIIYFGFAMMVVGSFRTAEAATEAREARIMEMGVSNG